MESVARGTSAEIRGVAGKLAGEAGLIPLKPRRIGVYQPWQPSMDEGWTRLVLEKFGFPYTTLHNAEVRAGGLRDRFDVLLLPSIPERSIRDGYAADATAPAYVGGLGAEGSRAVRDFIQAGGVLVCLDRSCPWAIDELKLPVADTLKGLKSSEFYCPGSILAAKVGSDSLLTVGVPAELSVYFDRSLAFDVKPTQPAARVALTYGTTEVLQSGWLLGPEKVRDRAALVEVPVGAGRVVLFGFPPQHRGQPHGTFRLLFNALLLAGLEGSRPE